MFFRILVFFIFSFCPVSFAQEDVDVGLPVKIPLPVAVEEPVAQVLPSVPVKVEAVDGRELLFQVEIADEPQERRIGMMYRKDVPQDTGMLFIFDNVEERQFWMKNTYVPLDLLFIDNDGVIESIAHNAEPESLRLLKSSGAVRAVLEIGGNVAAEKNINVGDRVLYDFPALGK